MSWIWLVAGPKSSSSWLILAQYIRKLGECGFFGRERRACTGNSISLKKECLFFFRDFEISPTISWMDEGESVESSVDSEIPGLSSADAIIAGVVEVYLELGILVGALCAIGLVKHYLSSIESGPASQGLA
jgi:hypothetical protein